MNFSSQTSSGLEDIERYRETARWLSSSCQAWCHSLLRPLRNVSDQHHVPILAHELPRRLRVLSSKIDSRRQSRTPAEEHHEHLDTECLQLRLYGYFREAQVAVLVRHHHQARTRSRQSNRGRVGLFHQRQFIPGEIETKETLSMGSRSDLGRLRASGQRLRSICYSPGRRRT